MLILIFQVGIYGQLVAENVINDGASDMDEGTCHTLISDLTESCTKAESVDTLEAEPNEQSEDEGVSQADTSSTIKHLPFK